ncbi:alkaline phosphatase PhoX [Coleofasciculus sp. E2-BRE-01]|uniref:alkaline phosphatase PhoX n=1 Tax=Coleofasciculus sp. E2-BRE-01 TaxID=3069524 RepID=UPI0032FF19D2
MLNKLTLSYFVCTSGGEIGQGQIFAYNPADHTLTLVVESERESELDNPDNITVAPFGDLFLCEDGNGEQFIVGVNAGGKIYKFARNAINTSEFAGVCFSPDGSKLFLNIQNPGITFCIQGVWS